MRKGDFLGKTIIAVEEAVKLGIAEDVIFDQDGQLHALLVKRGWLAGQTAIPVSEVIAFGPDAITVTTKAAMQDPRRVGSIRGLPTLRGALDCRVITLGGKLVGLIDDVEVDGVSRRILSFDLRRSNVVGMLMDEIAGGKLTIPYIGRLRYGKQAVVVPGSVIGERPLAELEVQLETEWVGQTISSAPQLKAPAPAPDSGTVEPDEGVLVGVSSQAPKIIRVADVQ